MNDLHESNRACWNEWADWWRRKADQRGTWRQCHRDPTLVLSPGEMHFLGDVRDRDVCVLGSGDNEVVFAMAGMGARVTSVDISERQLETAQERATILGLEVTFLRADVIDLCSIPDAQFDVVYTVGHISVWISDIGKYYGEAVRVLRPRGFVHRQRIPSNPADVARERRPMASSAWSNKRSICRWILSLAMPQPLNRSG